MTRIAAIDPATTTGETRALFDLVQSRLGVIPNMVRTMAQAPAVLTGYLGLSDALAGGTLSPRLREQLALAVSQANTCQYCVSAHTAIGEMVGLSASELESSRQGSAADPRTEAALQLARQIVEYRGELTDDEFSAVREAGYSDAEIAEIVANVVINIFTNYFNKIAQTEVDFPHVELGASAPDRAA